jgi:methionyl-tRNA formyltransferase
MKIVYFGTPQFAVPSIVRLLKDPDFEVVAVVTQPDKRRGRGSKVTPSPVKKVATEAGVPVWQPQKIKKDADTLNFLSTSGADAFVVVAYGQILSRNFRHATVGVDQWPWFDSTYLSGGSSHPVEFIQW